MLFRQASVDVRPPPQPSEPVRFDGDAYQPPKGWNVAPRVLRRPMSQKALIEAKQARQKPKEAPTLPSYCGDSNRPPPHPPMPETERMMLTEPESPKRKEVPQLSDGTALEAMYQQNRADDLARLMAPAPITTTDVDAQFRSRSQGPSELKGPTLTPDQLNAITARARKAKMKRQGVLKTGGNVVKSKDRIVLGTSQRRVKIPSGGDKHRTDQRQAIAKRRENKRPLPSIEVTDELRRSTTTAALKEFKARGVANMPRVLVLLMEFLSPSDGSGNEALFAYIHRRMLREEHDAPAKEYEVNRTFLLNAAKKAISDLVKSAKEMMNDDASEDVTNDREIRCRFGTERRRSSRVKDILQIRQRVMGGGCVLHFLISVKKSGQKTLLGVVIDRP